MLFKPFEGSLLSAHYPQPQVPKLTGICWEWVCIFRLSSSVYLRELCKHTQLLPHTDLQHTHPRTHTHQSGLQCPAFAAYFHSSHLLPTGHIVSPTGLCRASKFEWNWVNVPTCEIWLKECIFIDLKWAHYNTVSSHLLSYVSINQKSKSDPKPRIIQCGVTI